MLGAIVGDVAGSRFEWHNHRNKSFTLFTNRCFKTDDSIMTLAVAKAILTSEDEGCELAGQTVKYMQLLGRKYPHAGYGGHFRRWLYEEKPAPYGSFGNGAAMRVSACGWAADSLEKAKALSREVTRVTHDHPEGIKGAEAVCVAIYMARTGSTLEEIREHIRAEYYPQQFTLDEIREDYEFDETCQGSVPQAFEAFFESTGFEDTIRNAISIGGDSDTVAAIAGSIAEAYYGIPEHIRTEAMSFLDLTLLTILSDFELRYGIPPVKTPTR